MKYGDLPKPEITQKLTMTAFHTPEINVWAYRFHKAVLECAEFFENERTKQVKLLGEETEDGQTVVKKENIEKFREAMSSVTEMEIEPGKIPFFPLEIDMFSSNACQYSPDKEFWLSARDINAIMNCVDKLREEP